MYNRRYDKVFLMLRQETAGYAVGKRPPWGSCIMELKNGTGRLMLTVQGLRPLRYAVYLLAGQESIFCGELHPEKKEGHAELKWAFNPDAVGEGKRAEDFHTVLILRRRAAVLARLRLFRGENRLESHPSATERGRAAEEGRAAGNAEITGKNRP